MTFLYAKLQRLLPHIWYCRHPLVYSLWLLLWPFLLIYWLAIILRVWLYRRGIFQVYTVNVPVVVIGNITVGGTGKTPLAIALVQQLKGWGFHPGIISRGYGRESVGLMEVIPSSDPRLCGDEPVLMAQRTQVPVAVATQRVQAAKYLIDQKQCNIIVADDGLQHYALARDIEIVLIDGQRGLGNGCLLPLGPLREPSARLSRADFIVVNQPGTRLFAENTHVMHMVPGQLQPLSKQGQEAVNLSRWQGKIVHGVAGTGNPQRFFSQLQQAGLIVIPHIFPDHHIYRREELQFSNQSVIMTEKDAIKCQQMDLEHHWFLPIEAILNPEFWPLFLEKLQHRLDLAHNKPAANPRYK